MSSAVLDILCALSLSYNSPEESGRYSHFIDEETKVLRS